MTVDPATDAAGPTDDPVGEPSEVPEVDGDHGGVDHVDEVPTGTVDAVVWARIDWIAIGALFLCSLVLVGLHVRAYTTLSPIDELQHVDYVIKAGNFEPPHVNDLVGFDAMAEGACRNVDAPGYIGPRCGLDEYDPEDFQENGVNTAAGQFPFYYAATGVASRLVVGAGVLDSQVTAARMIGALWAGAAWSVMWYVLAILRVKRTRRVVALAALMTTAFTLFHSATVNADGVLMLTGALAVLVTLKFEAARLDGWLLLFAYAALYFVEPTNGLVIAPCVAYLAVRVSARSDLSWLRRVLPLLALPMVFLFRVRIAQAIHRFFFPASPRTNRPTMFTDNAVPDGVVWDKVLAQLDTLFTPVNYAFVPNFLASQHTAALQEVVNWLLIGAMFAVAIRTTTPHVLSDTVHSDERATSGTDDPDTIDPGAADRDMHDPDVHDLDAVDPDLFDPDAVEPSTGHADSVDADRDCSDALALDADDRAVWLTRFGMAALIVAGPLYTFSFAYFSNADFPAQARFALPLVTFLVLALAAALTTRWAMGAATTVVVLSSANLVWLLLTP